MRAYEDGVNRPLCYTLLLQWLSNAANECGYALGLHGSMVRDLDLIAAPWKEDAVSADQLVTKLVEACGGWLTQGETTVNPEFRPHGRTAYTIQLGRGLYIDVSVMPRSGDAQVSMFEKSESAKGQPAAPSVGQVVMEGIISSALFKAECPASPGAPCLVIWSSGAAEQIEAIVNSAQNFQP